MSKNYDKDGAYTTLQFTNAYHASHTELSSKTEHAANIYLTLAQWSRHYLLEISPKDNQRFATRSTEAWVVKSSFYALKNTLWKEMSAILSINDLVENVKTLSIAPAYM